MLCWTFWVVVRHSSEHLLFCSDSLWKTVRPRKTYCLMSDRVLLFYSNIEVKVGHLCINKKLYSALKKGIKLVWYVLSKHIILYKYSPFYTFYYFFCKEEIYKNSKFKTSTSNCWNVNIGIKSILTASIELEVLELLYTFGAIFIQHLREVCSRGWWDPCTV